MKPSFRILLVLVISVAICMFIAPSAFADGSSTSETNLTPSNSQEAINTETTPPVATTEANTTAGDENGAVNGTGTTVPEELAPNMQPEETNLSNPLDTLLVDPTFPAGTFVIPMDDKQADKIKAFGLVHKILTNGADVYRIIEPPDVTLKTTTYPAGSVYQGGPMIVMPSGAAAVAAARASFPTVTVDTLTESFTSSSVLMATRPTRILVVHGQYGHSDETMTGMGLPFTLVEQAEVAANPNMIFSYDVVVDDCPGGEGLLTENIINLVRTFVANGGEMIFTDIALLDLDQIFPNYVTVVSNADGDWDFTYHNTGDFLSQYSGPTVVSMYTMGGGNIVSATLNPNVKVLMDGNFDLYPSTYYIGAFYFTYGNGIVEGFAFHPGDQTNPYAILIASVLLGNKLIHTASTLETPSEAPAPTQQQEVLPVTGGSNLPAVLGGFLLLLGLATKLVIQKPTL